MAKFTSSQIRNICLVGHSGDGKTSFAEAMLYLAKVTDRLGKPSEGNTVCDFDPEEIKRGYSISTSLASLEWNGKKINILDAPGMFGFAGEAKAAAFVAASTVIVVDAKSGCKVGTELAWEYSAGKPKAFFVNKVDDENSNFEGTFNGLREQFGSSVCPLLIPFNEGSGQVGFYNLITDEVFYCEKNGNRVETSLPASFNDKIEEYKLALNESLAVTSEELMEKFLMEEPFTSEEKLSALNSGLLSGDIAPVFCGSATALSGIRFFLDTVAASFVSPLEAMKGADTVILLAGLAGGTGGGAIPFIASLALDYVGAKTIAVVTTPPNIVTPVGVIEGAKSKERAEKALANLRGVLDEENIHVIPTAKGTLATMHGNTDKLVAERVQEILEKLCF